MLNTVSFKHSAPVGFLVVVRFPPPPTADRTHGRARASRSASPRPAKDRLARQRDIGVRLAAAALVAARLCLAAMARGLLRVQSRTASMPIDALLRDLSAYDIAAIARRAPH